MSWVIDLLSAITSPVNVERSDGRVGALLPPGWTEKYDPDSTVEKPKYMEKRRSLDTIDDLIDYCEEFSEGDPTPHVWMDRDSTAVLAVLDPAQRGSPSFERHLAQARLKKTAQYKAWSQASEKWMDPRAFGRFLEDHVEDITGEFSGAKVLGMARDLNVKVNGEADLKIDVSSGERKVRMEAGTKLLGAETVFPEFITATMPVFRYTEKIDFQVRLRAEVDSTGPRFQIVMPEDEIVVDTTFDNLLEGMISRMPHGVYFYGSPFRDHSS